MPDPQDARTLTKDHPADLRPGHCEKCKAKVIVHCDECKRQVTACACSMRATVVSEIGEEGLRRLEDESRRDRLRQGGVWVP